MVTENLGKLCVIVHAGSITSLPFCMVLVKCNSLELGTAYSSFLDLLLYMCSGVHELGFLGPEAFKIVGRIQKKSLGILFLIERGTSLMLSSHFTTELHPHLKVIKF
jgi:hypothetical protein